MSLQFDLVNGLTKRNAGARVVGMPLDVLAAELQVNRNAVYKTMFDARKSSDPD